MERKKGVRCSMKALLIILATLLCIAGTKGAAVSFGADDKGKFVSYMVLAFVSIAILVKMVQDIMTGVEKLWIN